MKSLYWIRTKHSTDFSLLPLQKTYRQIVFQVSAQICYAKYKCSKGYSAKGHNPLLYHPANTGIPAGIGAVAQLSFVFLPSS